MSNTSHSENTPICSAEISASRSTQRLPTGSVEPLTTGPSPSSGEGRVRGDISVLMSERIHPRPEAVAFWCPGKEKKQIKWMVLFYGYAVGERSSRVIAHRVRSDVAYTYLSALEQPDFRTINWFRKDHVDLLKGFFIQIVRLCREMGMVSVGRIAIDGTKLKANASYRKTMRLRDLEEEIKVIDKQVEAILRECAEGVEREDEQMGQDHSPYDRPLN